MLRKSAFLISFVCLLMLGLASCSTQNPPVNAYTGATKTK
jgi:hypothetical protein